MLIQKEMRSWTIKLCLLIHCILFLGLSSFPAYSKIDEGKLVIWMSSDRGYSGLAEVGKTFEKATGKTVVIQHPDFMDERFPRIAATGDGPDIIFWTHDRFSNYAQAGLLSDLHPSKKILNNLDPTTWAALRYQDRIIGYPIVIETPSLIYNKALLNNPPESWEEIMTLGKKMQLQGLQAIMWDLQDPYLSWPLLAAEGGYIFKRENGSYNLQDVGIKHQGITNGLHFLLELTKNGQINAKMPYPIVEDAFLNGKIAMTINTPSLWATLDEYHINYGVTHLPSREGKNSQPLVNILSAGINAASPNKELAVNFLENYVLTDQGLETLNRDKPLGPVTLLSYRKKQLLDPRIATTLENARQGILIPNVPQIVGFSYALRCMLHGVLFEGQNITYALQDAYDRMTK